MNDLISHAGIAMPRWAFIQHYLCDWQMSPYIVERCAMQRRELAPDEAARLESFESACDRGWFDVPDWVKYRKGAAA